MRIPGPTSNPGFTPDIRPRPTHLSFRHDTSDRTFPFVGLGHLEFSRVSHWSRHKPPSYVVKVGVQEELPLRHPPSTHIPKIQKFLVLHLGWIKKRHRDVKRGSRLKFCVPEPEIKVLVESYQKNEVPDDPGPDEVVKKLK